MHICAKDFKHFFAGSSTYTQKRCATFHAVTIRTQIFQLRFYFEGESLSSLVWSEEGSYKMCQNRQWSVVAKILTSEDSADFLLSLFIQEMNHNSGGWDWWIFIGKTYATKFVGTYYELSVGPSVWYCGPLLPAGARRIKRQIWMVGSAVGHGGSGLVGWWAFQ